LLNFLICSFTRLEVESACLIVLTKKVKPVTKKPKPTPKPAPRSDRQKPDSTVHSIANSDNNHIDLTSNVESTVPSTTRFQIEFKLVYLYFKNYLYINNERKINPE
jgi:hypothetical protein